MAKNTPFLGDFPPKGLDCPRRARGGPGGQNLVPRVSDFAHGREISRARGGGGPPKNTSIRNPPSRGGPAGGPAGGGVSEMGVPGGPRGCRGPWADPPAPHPAPVLCPTG